jgi:hypothetical protein
MAWDVRNTYFYLVCFATLLMMIIGASQVVFRVLDLALPREPYGPTASELEMRYARPEPSDTASQYTREELEQMAEEEAERNARQQRRDAIRGLLGNLALVVIAAPVYLYHWRQVRRTQVS